MDSHSRLRRLRTSKGATLLLFPEDPPSSVECSRFPADQTPLTGFPACDPPLSLPHIIAEWPSLLKRLGRRRRVLETILRAGQPIRLTDDALLVGFPPDRRFHLELLAMSDYRSSVEEELARTFLLKLTLATCLHPEKRTFRREGEFGPSPA
jgi:hypothetical protein